MNSDHGRLRRLVLGCEDLEGSQREEALAHLAECPDCRRLREQVLAAEAVIRSVERLPEAEPAPDPAAKASLEALLGAVSGSRFTATRVVPLALAAALALVALAPLLGPSSPVRDLQVGSPLVLRGDSGAAADLRHGVSFRLNEAGYPVLIHVDGAGDARLLHPRQGEAPALYPEGELVFLPRPGAAGDWRENLAPGCETYVLAVIAADEPPEAQSLESFILKASPGPRRDAVGDLRRRLKDVFGNAAVRDDPDCP
ncbi:MAG: hypothetical protein AB7V45_02725 [Candidatus Krumholzibacteriia bacterium]